MYFHNFWSNQVAFKLTIETDNAAFQDGEPAFEVARILREVADAMENGTNEGPVRDVNGNRVGTFTLDTK